MLQSLRPYVVNKSKQLDLALQLLILKDRCKNERSFNRGLELALQIRGLNHYRKKHFSNNPVTTYMEGTR